MIVLEPDSLSQCAQHRPWRPNTSLVLAMFALLGTPAALLAQGNAPASAPAGSISLADYRARLQAMDQLVATCRRAPSPTNCQSNQVGPDAQVSVPGGTREVRFTWLRTVLTDAAKPPTVLPLVPQPASSDDEDDDSGDSPSQKSPAQKDAKQPAPQSPAPSPVLGIPVAPVNQAAALDAELQAAHTRLSEDMAEVDRLAGKPPATSSAGKERSALEAILAAKEYQTAVASPSLWSRIKEKLNEWLNRFFAALNNAGARSKWIGYAAEIGFVVLVCVALVWFLIRIERQGRLGLSLLRPSPGPGAASARDWQLWLADARKAAAEGDWRDAIHLLYWASISRLESSGLWPADRARTPREYLALLGPESAQRPDLAAISRSFELTWYAGRPAAEADFLRAEQIAANLGAGSVAARSGPRDSEAAR